MTKRRFDSVTFVGGPLDGVCWPCVVRPDLLAIRTIEGRIHLYECDQMSAEEDGATDYRMVPTMNREEWYEEFLTKPQEGESHGS